VLLVTGAYYPEISASGLQCRTVARALAALDARTPLAGVVEILLMGPHVEEFRDDAEQLGLGAIVRFEGRRPRADAHRAAADADVLLVVDAPSDGDSVFLPSKLVEYLAFRTPILGLTPRAGASARLLDRLGCLVAAPEDDGEIAEALSTLLERWRGGTLDVGARFDAVRAEYDVRRTTARLDEILTSAFARAA
jgi:glycosyltransferase involved in cell wall biosynthesis